MNQTYSLPRNIICLTEESVETLYAIGLQEIVKGVSIFVKRPAEAMNKPKVSAFTDSKIEKIVAMKPDLVIGFSDIQKDIARELIEKGINVYISNQRSISEILSYILTLTHMVGEAKKGQELVEKLNQKIQEIAKLSKELKHKPKVYFEEWDEPKISDIQWVSESIEIAGGINIFAKESEGKLAKERFVTDEQIIKANPDIILGCWCGKKVNLESIKKRQSWQNIEAVKNNQLFELAPEIFLQPGPAPIIDGLDQLFQIFKKWSDSQP